MAEREPSPQSGSVWHGPAAPSDAPSRSRGSPGAPLPLPQGSGTPTVRRSSRSGICCSVLPRETPSWPQTLSWTLSRMDVFAQSQILAELWVPPQLARLRCDSPYGRRSSWSRSHERSCLEQLRGPSKLFLVSSQTTRDRMHRRLSLRITRMTAWRHLFEQELRRSYGGVAMRIECANIGNDQVTASRRSQWCSWDPQGAGWRKRTLANEAYVACAR